MSSDRHVLLVPDYNGESAERLLNTPLGSGSELLVVVNGDNEAQMGRAKQVLAEQSFLWSKKGLDNALGAGYAEALRRHPGLHVVRADTAEQPLAATHHLAAGLEEYDMVIGDLSFDERTLRPGSADAYHNTGVVPGVLAAFTGGALSLTGAHGYQAVRSDMLTRALPVTFKVLARASKLKGEEVTWGFDTALALVVHRLGGSINVTRIPAIEMRDRPQEKCQAQLDDLLYVLLAWRDLGGE